MPTNAVHPAADEPGRRATETGKLIELGEEAAGGADASSADGKGKEHKPPTATLGELFQFATGFDYLLMSVGCLFGFFSGFLQVSCVCASSRA